MEEISYAIEESSMEVPSPFFPWKNFLDNSKDIHFRNLKQMGLNQ